MEFDSAFEARMKKRYRAERRFKGYCITGLATALVFLLVFFTDIIVKALPALQQAEVRITYVYNEESADFPSAGIQEDYYELVSRGWLRIVPKRMRDNPELMGTTEQTWALATDGVDQYLKGQYNKLSEEEQALADRMVAAGNLRLAFNTGFFTTGDSKLPEMAGLWASLVGSIYVMILTFLFAFPLGVMTAVYLEEFAPENKLTQLIEVNINNLAAVPSIIFGLLGLAVFINFFGVPRSTVLAGGLTMGIMTLPLIIISARAALRAVPDSIRQGALAMGASRWQMVKDHVLPLAMPGVLTGTIIGMAVAIGETAPLLIIGMVAYIPNAPETFTDAATVLPAQIYTWAGEPERSYVSRTALGIMVLLTAMITMNATAVYLRNRFTRRW
ncbi:phosphate transport system permease protein [Methylohalomonas lacus]|uniref:Phosphate transport system permease protein PstA n=1 Tax=Methylohalomonas lacus TaxID=398773 RepID=A0AAE3HMR8_9GAMM|nr:phosphate ABC transporter permease PstA [Methylohalomonas lacus]MCS3903967.1 phosphate transport system permease protein [Methylohalomonas lacus]